MTKSDLIDLMASEQSNLSERDVEFAIKAILQQMSNALASGERIEIRGFGNYKLHFRPPRIGRNPKTGGTDRPDWNSPVFRYTSKVSIRCRPWRAKAKAGSPRQG